MGDFSQYDDFEPAEERLFNLQEAEDLIPQLTEWLTVAIGHRHKVQSIEKEFSAIQSRILLRGGLLPPHAELAERRMERERYVKPLREALERIAQTGCQIKDLDIGLIDFPSIVGNEPALLCWKLGEERIRYWHRADEGFAGRKPLEGVDPVGPDDDRPN